MFAHNRYWLHPANCQLFSVHVKPKSLRATFLGRTKEKILARKLSRQGMMLPTLSFSGRNVCRLSLLVEFLPVE